MKVRYPVSAVEEFIAAGRSRSGAEQGPTQPQII
jgi:hypothetical protein